MKAVKAAINNVVKSPEHALLVEATQRVNFEKDYEVSWHLEEIQVIDAVTDLIAHNRELRARIQFLENQLSPDHGAYIRVPRNLTAEMEQAIFHANRCAEPFIETGKEAWAIHKIWDAALSVFLRQGSTK